MKLRRLILTFSFAIFITACTPQRAMKTGRDLVLKTMHQEDDLTIQAPPTPELQHTTPDDFPIITKNMTTAAETTSKAIMKNVSSDVPAPDAISTPPSTATVPVKKSRATDTPVYYKIVSGNTETDRYKDLSDTEKIPLILSDPLVKSPGVDGTMSRTLPYNERLTYISKNDVVVNPYLGFEYDLPQDGRWYVGINMNDDTDPLSPGTEKEETPFECLDLNSTVQRGVRSIVYYGYFGGSVNYVTARSTWRSLKLEGEQEYDALPEPYTLDGLPFEYITFEKEENERKLAVTERGSFIYDVQNDHKQPVQIGCFFGKYHEVAYLFVITSPVDQYENDLAQFKESIHFWK